MAYGQPKIFARKLEFSVLNTLSDIHVQIVAFLLFTKLTLSLRDSLGQALCPVRSCDVEAAPPRCSWESGSDNNADTLHCSLFITMLLSSTSISYSRVQYTPAAHFNFPAPSPLAYKLNLVKSLFTSQNYAKTVIFQHHFGFQWRIHYIVSCGLRIFWTCYIVLLLN